MGDVIHQVKLGGPKNRGVSPKMDGENNGKPYGQMDDLGGKPTIFGNIQIEIEVSYATAARSFMCLGPTDPERVTRSRERLRFNS